MENKIMLLSEFVKRTIGPENRKCIHFKEFKKLYMETGLTKYNIYNLFNIFSLMESLAEGTITARDYKWYLIDLLKYLLDDADF